MFFGPQKSEGMRCLFAEKSDFALRRRIGRSVRQQFLKPAS